MDKPLILKRENDVPHGATIVDIYAQAVKELFFATHPNYKKNSGEAQAPLEKFIASKKNDSVWIYYPWRNIAVHSLNEEDYFILRTARNHDVITPTEQVQYRNALVGILGLSVGSGVLSALVISGGPKTIKVADFDTLEISNLNRIRASLLDVGSNKTEIAARGVWELDPFANLYLWDKGVDEKNLYDFILGKPKLDIVIDEMDSIGLKILARHICKENKIPILMATDNGDGIILDVERFDLEPERQIFHGLIEGITVESKPTPQEWLQLATKIIGPKYMTDRHQESILKIGKSLAGVPQLGTTAAMAGAAVAYVVRRIANGETMRSGRYTFGFEEKLTHAYNGAKQKERRAATTKKFVKEMRLRLRPQKS